MPVRKKIDRRRHGADLKAWETYLECGYDFFGDLPGAGIQVDPNGHPSAEDAAAAWVEYGSELREMWSLTRRDVDNDAWAIERFGLPVRKG